MVGPFAIDQQIFPRHAFLVESGARQKFAGGVIAGQAGRLDPVQTQGAESCAREVR